MPKVWGWFWEGHKRVYRKYWPDEETPDPTADPGEKDELWNGKGMSGVRPLSEKERLGLFIQTGQEFQTSGDLDKWCRENDRRITEPGDGIHKKIDEINEKEGDYGREISEADVGASMTQAKKILTGSKERVKHLREGGIHDGLRNDD